MYVTEFVTQLEYHLSHLACKNEHHRFEKLCVEVARRRIATNIFVATGPVGAGGDGARDGETYATELPYEVATWFSVRATTARVIVACSTKSDYKGKICEDVRRIQVARDGIFDRIVYFSNQVIAEGERRKLREKLGCTSDQLAIWDRFNIARVLAEPDLQWIAQHYLELPPEFVESLEPDDEFGLDFDDEDFYVPGQALVDALDVALALAPTEPCETSRAIADLHRRYVALYLALDRLPVTDQHAYELSRQYGEAADALREGGSSGANALKAYGLLDWQPSDRRLINAEDRLMASLNRTTTISHSGRLHIEEARVATFAGGGCG